MTRGKITVVFFKCRVLFGFITQSSFSLHLESAGDKGANNTTNDDGNTANGGSMTFKKALEISYKFRSSAVNDTISGFMSTFFH
jgi:hypothetical protein